jgi:hypothetical protein
VMVEAAAAVLGPDVWIDTDVSIVKYPNRYSDPRGQVMWDRVMSLLRRQSLVTSSTSGT